MDPFEELKSHYPELIAELPKRFTSHEFILKLAHQYQHLYIKALAQYADQESSPFQTVHGRLAKALGDFPDLVKYVGAEPSRNIFGHVTEAALWRKA